MAKFSTNYVKRTGYVPYKGRETGGQPKLQVNDAMTPREILNRYATGIDLRRLARFGVYDDDDKELNDIVLSSPFSDLTEVEALIEDQEAFNQRVEEAKALKARLEAEQLEAPKEAPTEAPPEEPTE